MTIRNTDEGRIILSRIEEQVGLDTLADWVVEGALEYKKKPELRHVMLSEFIVGYCEKRFKDTRHPVVRQFVYQPEEVEI